MRSKITSAFLAALAMTGMSAVHAEQGTRMTLNAPDVMPTRRGLFLSGGSSTGSTRRVKRGPGWTCAHVKRMAVKRNNRTRNRKAQR